MTAHDRPLGAPDGPAAGPTAGPALPLGHGFGHDLGPGPGPLFDPVFDPDPRPDFRPGSRRGPDPKRAFDLLAGAALLVALAPLLGLVALALRAADDRPVLRRRTVAGRDGRPFTMLTFRTRSPLAALPLLLHVVRGEMSLVGPCPLTPAHPECTGEARRRLTVRPGLTGPWQISGRSELPWEERELLDLHYVDHHWLGMDLAVLARTLPAVRRRRLRRASARAARLA
ncbi:sugar transferase [Streptomyces termitum]|uniref:sugar transferase n=1 Tax=Streptomyces termitum TaxID=67368 RepID=UPI0037903E1D